MLGIRRPQFITLLGSAAAAVRPLAASAQQVMKIPRIGVLSPGRSELPDPTRNMLNAFLEGLHELGYAEGQSVAIERQYAEGRSDRLPELTDALLRRKVDIIVAFSTTAAAPPSKHQHNSHRGGSDGRSSGRRVSREPCAPRRECDGDNVSWSRLGRQTPSTAKGDCSRALPRSGTMASSCIQRTHDVRRIEGGRECGRHLGTAASTRASG